MKIDDIHTSFQWDKSPFGGGGLRKIFHNESYRFKLRVMSKLKLIRPLTDYGLEIPTEEDLLKSFSIKDQAKLVMPSKFVFPLRTKYYFTWLSPDGLYLYLVFKKPGWASPRGIIFRGSNTSHAATTAMCEFCHSFGPSSEIGMLLTSVDSKKTIGMMMCLDLSCIEKTETIALIAGKNFDSLADKIGQRLSNFFEHTLKSETGN